MSSPPTSFKPLIAPLEFQGSCKRAISQVFIATQRAAEAALLWWRFASSTLTLWLFLCFLQGPKINPSQSTEGFVVWSGQSFKRVGVDREGQHMLLLSDLSTHDWPVRRVKLRILFLEMCHGGVYFRGVRNTNKHLGLPREVRGVNHSQLRTLQQLSESTNCPH